MNPESETHSKASDENQALPVQAAAATESPTGALPVTSKKKSKIIILILIIVVLVAAGVTVYFKIYGHKTAKKPTPPVGKVVPSSSPAPTYSSALIFQPTNSSTSSTTSIVGLDGTVKHSFSSVVSSDTYDDSILSQTNLQLLDGSSLITSDKSFTSFADINPDGNVTPVASSLNTLLSTNVKPGNAVLSDLITIDTSTLLALESSPSTNSYQFLKVNLTTGVVSTLLSIKPTVPVSIGYTPVDQVSTSLDGSTVYLITDSVDLNSTAAAGISLVTYNLSKGTFTLKALPAGLQSPIALSKDGSLVAYQTSSVNNGYESLASHILNTKSGKDSVVSGGEGLATSSGSDDLRFSPNGAYLSETGNYAADTKKAGMGLQIISTTTDAIVQQVNLVGVQYNLTGYSWAGNNDMIYSTNSSPNGVFNSMLETVHSIDAASGTVFNFPSNLGELVAVLNYQL